MEPFTIKDLERVRWEHRNKPKRKHRKTHSKISIAFQDLNRIISRRWKAVPESERRMYHEQAKREKLEHAQRLRDWQKTQKGASQSGSSDSGTFHLPELEDILSPGTAFFDGPEHDALPGGQPQPIISLNQLEQQPCNVPSGMQDEVSDQAVLPMDGSFEPIPFSWEQEGQREVDNTPPVLSLRSLLSAPTRAPLPAQLHCSMKLGRTMSANEETSSPETIQGHCSIADFSGGNEMYEPLDARVMESLFD